MKLSELQNGAEAIVVNVGGHGAFRKRIMEMGFINGRRVKSLLEAPLHDPIKYSVLGYEVSLRRSEADLVEVMPVPANAPVEDEKPKKAKVSKCCSCSEDCTACSPLQHEITDGNGRKIKVALVGNPNCGKTSLFNIVSGAREHVGNYSGVTVDSKTGHYNYRGFRIEIVDLPGTYSLTSYSPEEMYVRNYLHDESPDVIINVVDSSNLERNLYLATELIDMDRSMVIALNMYDELQKSGARFNYSELGKMIGVPMCPIVAKTGAGVSQLFDTVISVYEGINPDVRHIHVNLGPDIEAMLRTLIDNIKQRDDIDRQFSPRYLAIKLVEGDGPVEEMVGPELVALRDKLVAQYKSLHPNDDLQQTITARKYGFIEGALAETFVPGDTGKWNNTRVIDSIVTNKLFGFPIFLAIMFVVFWATFSIGQYPMDWIEEGVTWIGEKCAAWLPEGWFSDMVNDGIIGGVGSVIVFLPNILILYFCISFMEDSGYMSRAAFIMDKLMHKIGVHGKSFIPLVMGFGCNVPAIMATRTIESRSSRLITILINPFMSCSARVPIIVLLVGTFFPHHSTLVFMSLYVAGIIVAVITAKLLRRFVYKTDETPFVMELPPYRIPTLKASLRHTWAKGEQYLKKMGGIILVASIAVWALNYFPLDSHDNPDKDSYLEMAGKFVNPVMEPVGFHWRASVAALAGVPAKEIVVSTLGVLYTGDEEVDDQTLGDKLQTPNPVTGVPDFTPAAALSFLIFVLLYCPCIASLTAIARETGSWKYAAFSAAYNTVVAWIVAYLVYIITCAI